MQCCEHTFAFVEILKGGRIKLHIHGVRGRIFECGWFLTLSNAPLNRGPPSKLNLPPSRQRHRSQSQTTLSRWQFLPSEKMSENWLPISKLGGADDRRGDYLCVDCTNLPCESGRNHFKHTEPPNLLQTFRSLLISEFSEHPSRVKSRR